MQHVLLPTLAVLRDAALVQVRANLHQALATRRRLAHPARDFLRKILRVELIDRLDDRFHQLAGGRVVGVLGDRGDPNPTPAQHRLEGDGMLTLARKARKLPDQDLLEGSVRLLGFVEHLLELRPVGHAAGFGLVDVLASDTVAVALSEVT